MVVNGSMRRVSCRRLALMPFPQARREVNSALAEHLARESGQIATLFTSRSHLRRAGLTSVVTTIDISLLLYIVKTQRYFVDAKGRLWRLEKAEKTRKRGMKATQLYFRRVDGRYG